MSNSQSQSQYLTRSISNLQELWENVWTEPLKLKVIKFGR